jgi:hypothetical protein
MRHFPLWLLLAALLGGCLLDMSRAIPMAGDPHAQRGRISFQP